MTELGRLLARQLARLRRCPVCGARPLRRCTFLFQGVRRVPLGTTHPSRVPGRA